MKCQITFSADDKLAIFFLQKIGFGISCKLPPKEIICMNCQIPFSEKRKIFQNAVC